MLLACQAHFPSLRAPATVRHREPPQRVHDGERPEPEPADAGPVRVIRIGEGAVRVCAAALGGDQFDGDDPRELRGKASFFNWYAFCILLGGFVGLVFVVWVQNNESWGLGFMLSALVALLGTPVLVAGLPFYRHQKPTGSPLTRMLQVFVAAFRKRIFQCLRIWLGCTRPPASKCWREHQVSTVDDGDARRWSLCTVTQVEEAKIILWMLPVFVSSVLGYLPIPLLLTFTVQQGGTMDTRLGGTHVPPASLFVIPIVFQMLTLVVYDRAVSCRGCAAARVRRRHHAPAADRGRVRVQRRGARRGRGRRDVCVLADATVLPAGRHGRHLLRRPARVLLQRGLRRHEVHRGRRLLLHPRRRVAWLGSVLIQVVNRVTARHGRGTGWLDGASLSAGRLDLFYWLLALFGFVALLLYLLCAWRYTYRHHPSRMQSAMEDHRVSPASKKLDAAL